MPEASVDDPSILDEDDLCRRVRPDCVVKDEIGEKRVSSAAFSNHRGTNALSVYIKRGLKDPQEVLFPGHGLAQLKAGFARKCCQILVRDTGVGQHAAHAHMVGDKSQSVRRRLAEAATQAGWVVEPSSGHAVS